MLICYEYFNNDLIEMTEKKIIVDGHEIYNNVCVCVCVYKKIYRMFHLLALEKEYTSHIQFKNNK